jgi:glycosyltransferase involved in cell wall biosynthesis
VGRFGSHEHVVERVVPRRNKALWDQVAIPRACRRERIDLLFHPKFTVPLIAGVPSVMVLHGADWFLPEAAQFYTRLDRAYIRTFMPLYLRKAAAVLSVSQLTTDHFDRIFQMPDGKIRTTYFGPAPHFGRVADPRTLEAVRLKYGLPDRFILTLSKVAGGERKNMRGILDAYSRISGASNHDLVVGGKGCDRFRLEYGIPADKWGARVHFPGWIDQADLPSVYTLAGLFLYPSNQEAFPIPVTEAMSCGTPIVTSDVNGLAEIAGDAALLVDPTDAGAIADAVLRIIRSPELRKRLASAGLERANSFSWENCARRTRAVLEQCHSRRSRDNARAA